MGLDNAVSSPHRRSQGASASASPRKKFAQNDISFPTLMQRHRFLLTALVLLVLLCTVYLYFAVTMGSRSCSGLLGTEKEMCLLKLGKEPFTKGKLKLF
ncbi:Endoplasmic reticulum junction formation protein lunapark-B [Bienertia sinuspersici]